MRNGRKALRSLLIEPRRDEHVDLRGDHREGDEHGAEQRELHLGEEELLRRGVDHLDRRIDAGGEPVGKEQEIVDRPGEIEANEEGGDDRGSDQISRRRSSTRCSISGALVASMSSSVTAWAPPQPLGARLLGLCLAASLRLRGGFLDARLGFWRRAFALRPWTTSAGRPAPAAAAFGRRRRRGLRHHDRLVDRRLEIDRTPSLQSSSPS